MRMKHHFFIDARDYTEALHKQAQDTTVAAMCTKVVEYAEGKPFSFKFVKVVEITEKDTLLPSRLFEVVAEVNVT